MKLIWHADGLRERDWLTRMLGDVVDEEIDDPGLACVTEDAIHVVSSNWRPLADYEAYAASCRARARHHVLIHLSDEWFSGGYRLYRHFDAVIRNFHTRLASGPGILTIPEGYSNGTAVDGAFKPATARPYAWSFVGEIKASRADMVRALDGVGPALLLGTSSISGSGDGRMTKPAYDAALADSVFSPCPMGNAILETWRLYESLELGCIPLLERRSTLDYFGNLFGEHPIPTFRNWHGARTWMETAYADPIRLVHLQRDIGAWWNRHKRDVQRAIRATVEGPSHAGALARFAAKPRNRWPPLHEPIRLGELTRHQSAASLMRRLSRPAGPLRRIVADGLRA